MSHIFEKHLETQVICREITSLDFHDEVTTGMWNYENEVTI